MTTNLTLWRAVEKTPPDQTKAITGKPYKGTSPKPYWLVQKATETFGPCGIGWGFEIVSERVEDGATGDKVHIAHIRLWYEYGSKRGVVEHVGQTMFAGKNKNGPYTDEDAPKKSVTDAVVKALSMIGFAGDIFMGRYDDSKYVSDLRAEETATKKAAAAPKDDDGNPFAPDEAEIERDELIRLVGICKTRDDLVSLWKSARVQEFLRTADITLIHSVTAAKDARKAALPEQKEAA